MELTEEDKNLIEGKESRIIRDIFRRKWHFSWKFEVYIEIIHVKGLG